MTQKPPSKAAGENVTSGTNKTEDNFFFVIFCFVFFCFILIALRNCANAVLGLGGT